MRNGKVHICLIASGENPANCPCDSYSCFDCHSRTPRRRKPQLQNGRFNYIPTRCRYLLEDKECPQVCTLFYMVCTLASVLLKSHPRRIFDISCFFLVPFHSSGNSWSVFNLVCGRRLGCTLSFCARHRGGNPPTVVASTF